MPNENDAKQEAIDYRHTPQTEKILRQFLSLESGNYVSRQMRKNYDVAIHGSPALEKPLYCTKCDYVATHVADVLWHTERIEGHVDFLLEKVPADWVKP